MAKMVIRMGNIHFSLPFSLATTQAIPALIAPVFIVTPRKPPMMSTNMATSMAPNSSPIVPYIDAAILSLDAIHAVDRSLERALEQLLRVGSTSW